MSALPLKTAISDIYPNPSNATARAGFAALWDAINETLEKSELDLASAATCDIGGQLSMKLRITGTTTITSFGTNYRGPILLRMSGIVTITHNATTLRCPGATNITTAAGDVLLAWPTATVSGTIDGWQVAILARGTGGATFTGAVTIPTVAIAAGTITGITDLAIADGGTGASTAATAFANLKQAASETASGAIEIATAAEVGAGSDALRAVPPAYMHMHYSSSKAWVVFDGTAGVGAITPLASQGVTSVSKASTGIYTITFNFTFASVYYAPSFFAQDDNSVGAVVLSRHAADTKTTTAFTFRCMDTGSGTLVDSAYICLNFFGYR